MFTSDKARFVQLILFSNLFSLNTAVKMENSSAETLNLKKWGHLRKILERAGPYDTENFTASPDNLEFLMNSCKILVIGKFLKISRFKTNLSFLI